MMYNYSNRLFDSKVNLTLKSSKCVFSSIQLDFLYFKMSEGQIRLEYKVEAILIYPEPRYAHEER